jgi:hypothetical protein
VTRTFASWTTRQVRDLSASRYIDSYLPVGTLEGDYVDLVANPERYTGYAGPSAARVWRSIYEENCFGLSEMNLLMGKGSAPVTLPDTMMDPFRDETGEARGTCLEKRVYYKIISGTSSKHSHLL